VASKKEKLRLRLQQALEAARPTVISEALAEELREAVGQSSDRMWRQLLHECGVPMVPLIEGVRQDDFLKLERTLLALAQEYMRAATWNDLPGKRRCRQFVIQAKDHARLTARNEKVAESRRAEKAEMALWMLTWLENPEIFELWLPLRKKQLTAVPHSPPG
jgi:hypothetical protein